MLTKQRDISQAQNLAIDDGSDKFKYSVNLGP